MVETGSNKVNIGEVLHCEPQFQWSVVWVGDQRPALISNDALYVAGLHDFEVGIQEESSGIRYQVSMYRGLYGWRLQDGQPAGSYG